MTKEMYTPPEAVVVEFGEEDVVVCSDYGDGGAWEEEKENPFE